MARKTSDRNLFQTCTVMLRHSAMFVMLLLVTSTSGLCQAKPYFSWFLSQVLNKPVIDQTGLTKFYDFKLEWTPELRDGFVPRDGAGPPPTNGPDIFTAVREQLGLKLDSHKGPVEVMIIDHVEKPSEN